MRTYTVDWCSNAGIFRKLGLGMLGLVVMIGISSPGQAQTASVTLTPSVASPQKLGTPVTWTAAVQNAPAGHTYDYQYTVTFNGQAQITRDFNSAATFPWVPHTVEGVYQVSVIVRDITTAPFMRFAPVSASFTLQPWVTAPMADGVVNPTAHPLVALFSAPPCSPGHQLEVSFHPVGTETAMTTSPIACSAQSANFLVAGMYPSTQYLMHWEEFDATSQVSAGADLPFTTGALPSAFPVPKFQVNVPATAHDAPYPVVLFMFFEIWPTATDLAGNIIWYSPGGATMVRIEKGGTYYSYGLAPTFDGNGTLTQYDLAGNAILQTNVEILNEQLAAKGYPAMVGFNAHEARHLPNGDLIVLAGRDVLSTSAQGGTPSNPVDIEGDMVLVLDHNLQLVWAWDSFAHEDINRAGTLNETCTPTGGGCPPLSPGIQKANDWLHTNFAQGTADGNIILSQRAQDMVLKINYANGTGDGSVIWRMGAGLDFTIVNPPTSPACGSPNVFPWFTHQHDSAFQYDENGKAGTVMTIFDDGNTRAEKCSGTQNSRGMVLFVNEAARQVYIESSVDLGGYSSALGSSQLLTPGDGNLYASYDNGFLSNQVQSTETDLAGKIVYELQGNSASYRTYRMHNLDTPTFPFTATGIYPVSSTPLQFGAIPFGTTEVQPATLSNFGLTGTATVGTSINGSSYKVLTSSQNTCQAGITAGQSCTLPVQFAPVSIATHDDVLTLETSGSSSPAIALDGVATGLTVSGGPLNFGAVPYGSSSILTLTITNHGVPGTVMEGIATSGPSYSIVTTAQNTCASGVKQGHSCTLPVQFKPDSVGGHNGTLTLTPTGGAAPVNVSLIGSGSGLTVSTSPLNFGTIPFGSTLTLSLTITNSGLPGTVTFGTAVTGHSYKVLTTSQNTCLAGITAGQNCTLPVEFDPTSVGGHGDTLTLTPSATGTAPILIGLEGTAAK